MNAIEPRHFSSIKYSISFALILVLYCSIAQAKVTGHCSNCHTMHNSQDGGVFAVDDKPSQALLRQDCVGCHTGDNSPLGSVTSGEGYTPFVHSFGDAVYGNHGTDGTTLAGGTFDYIEQFPATGHNVAGIDTSGGPGVIPPGYDSNIAAEAGIGDWSTQQVTCAGTYGCHGNHNTENQFNAVRGGHHQGVNGGAIEPETDSSPAAGYRMLVGIAGYEDPTWEYQPTSSKHNQYKGTITADQTDTISYLCAQCHGQFHSSDTVGTGSPWLRHPTDYAMKSTGEYANYGGNNINDYQPATPLASSNINTVVSKITFFNDSIVTCLSCHRAHGSPYYKAMRWDYAGSNTGGLCANCHTSKN